jgi:hypothetical protein
MTSHQSAAYDAAQPDPRRPETRGRPIKRGEIADAVIHIRTSMARKTSYVCAAGGRKLTDWIIENLDLAATPGDRPPPGT